MRRFYQTYQIQQTLSVKLSWSHYCELLLIAEDDKRSFYEKECVNVGWSVRELKRQMETSLYERLLLSSGTENQERVLELALNGNEITKPSDIIKDPYVFEFLGIPEDKPVLESDLEKALVEHIEKFLLELGKGFMFVGTQQRITLGNEHYYVDMVFYNKILHSYVLIELKTKKLMPAAVGQLNMYLNYYAEEVNEESDNPPIGIILCTDRDFLGAEYALGGLNNNIFASKYTYVIPDKEELIAQVEAVLEKWNDKDGNEKTTEFAWITSIQITKTNAKKLVAAGRHRWKIENQGFNRQKHWQGNIEHACSWNERAQKNHYLIEQIADFMKQLYEYFYLEKNEIKKLQKNISPELLASFGRQLTETEDISSELHNAVLN